jgi:hypothetical protein
MVLSFSLYKIGTTWEVHVLVYAKYLEHYLAHKFAM